MMRGQLQHNQRLDCLVIGGGPTGLTAALYSRASGVHVVDRGVGRPASIPLTRNYPGLPDGITGRGIESLRYPAFGHDLARSLDLVMSRLEFLIRNHRLRDMRSIRV